MDETLIYYGAPVLVAIPAINTFNIPVSPYFTSAGTVVYLPESAVILGPSSAHLPAVGTLHE